MLARCFNPSGPNPAWVSDTTHIRTRSGWPYLAVVLDLYARKVVGWAMALSMHAELVCAALQLAIAQRQPAPGLIVQSDRLNPPNTRARFIRRCWPVTAWSAA